MKTSITNEQIVFNDFFTILKAQVTYPSFETGEIIKANRLCLERGDSIAVLLYEANTDSFLFTEQYRYPSARRNQPFMLELVAGSLEANENPISCARREVLEELGYRVKELELISSYFPSPGGCSEQIHIFFATVNSHDKIKKGGGVDSEKESIQLIKIKKEAIREKLANGYFNNSITIIGLQWYLLYH